MIPPTPATTIPAICAVDNTGFPLSGDEDALVAAAGCDTPVDDFESVVELGVVVAVAADVVADAVVRRVVATDPLALVVATGAICTILEPDCSTRVAVRVLCVLGSALLSELHILYAFNTVSSTRQISKIYRANFNNHSLEESSPIQKPILASDIIHCTAPSPTVYVDLLPFSHRQFKVGVSPQTLDGKLSSTKDSKQT